jgi:hypothetical protein
MSTLAQERESRREQERALHADIPVFPCGLAIRLGRYRRNHGAVVRCQASVRGLGA